jgi:hypothetical protein
MWNHKLTDRSTQAPHKSNRVKSRTLAPYASRKQNHRTHQSSYKGRGRWLVYRRDLGRTAKGPSEIDDGDSGGRLRRWKRSHRTGSGEEGEAPNGGGNPNAHPCARFYHRGAPIFCARASPSRQGAHCPRWRGKLASRRWPRSGWRGEANEKIHQNDMTTWARCTKSYQMGLRMPPSGQPITP